MHNYCKRTRLFISSAPVWSSKTSWSLAMSGKYPFWSFPLFFWFTAVAVGFQLVSVKRVSIKCISITMRVSKVAWQHGEERQGAGVMQRWLYFLFWALLKLSDPSHSRQARVCDPCLRLCHPQVCPSLRIPHWSLIDPSWDGIQGDTDGCSGPLSPFPSHSRLSSRISAWPKPRQAQEGEFWLLRGGSPPSGDHKAPPGHSWEHRMGFGKAAGLTGWSTWCLMGGNGVWYPAAAFPVFTHP